MDYGVVGTEDDRLSMESVWRDIKSKEDGDDCAICGISITEHQLLYAELGVVMLCLADA